MMKDEVKGKRILLLGGYTLMTHVINKAKEMGIYTIVTDYIPDSPAKKYADESYDISTTDVDAIVELVKKTKADGIFPGYVDINLAPARMACEKLGIPCYATLDQIEQTMNKINFKANCRKFGISVADDIPQEYLDGEYNKVDFPVIVKPADSYSSRGISVCHRKEELGHAISYAIEVSPTNQFLVEKFISADDVYLYFTVQDGYVSLSAMADRLLSDEQYGCAPQPLGYFFPSKYLDMYLSKIHPKVQNMIKSLGIENGTFFMQGFAFENDIIFFEMGLRLSGGAGYLHIEKQNEISQIEMHLNYALTGKFCGYDVKKNDNPHFKNPSCVVVILLKDGVIADIQGLEEVKKHNNVFDMFQLKDVGDVLSAHGTLNQVFARIYCTADTNSELNLTIKYIRDNLKVIDKNGNNMIL